MRKIRAIYRKYWDFPRNWKPYEWNKNELSDSYWDGYTIDSLSSKFRKHPKLARALDKMYGTKAKKPK